MIVVILVVVPQLSLWHLLRVVPGLPIVLLQGRFESIHLVLAALLQVPFDGLLPVGQNLLLLLQVLVLVEAFSILFHPLVVHIVVVLGVHFDRLAFLFLLRLLQMILSIKFILVFLFLVLQDFFVVLDHLLELDVLSS